MLSPLGTAETLRGIIELTEGSWFVPGKKSLPDKFGEGCILHAPATSAGSCGAHDIFSATLGSPTMVFRSWPSASASLWGFNGSIDLFDVDPSVDGITPLTLFTGRGFFKILLGSWQGWDLERDLSPAEVPAPSCAAAAD